MSQTGFYWDERCFWHGGGNYAFTQPVGGLVQPLAAGGLAENPETKRRLKNLMDVTGITKDLDMQSSNPASMKDLLAVHPKKYLEKFKALSDVDGGLLGLRTPFARGGFDIAALSSGLAISAISDVLKGKYKNSYSLSRPPGHHCLPDYPNGFCLLANIAVAIEHSIKNKLGKKFCVIDWDVHHGNGTEAIFYNRNDVLTISIHQERNYPVDTGMETHQGKQEGLGYNVNLPLPAGSGHQAYLNLFDRIIDPIVSNYSPDIIIVACGFDAAMIDPLSSMLCSAETFRLLTRKAQKLADEQCDGKLALVHEGGYSEVYVPFCGHAVLEELSGSQIIAKDPYEELFSLRQPGSRFENMINEVLNDWEELFLK
jgi:acetoin utilization deacetylase AcuC-like enzyme